MSALVGIRVRTGQIREVIAPVIGRLKDPNGRGVDRKVVKAIRDSAAREFLEQAWFEPSGAKRAWPKNVPFGIAADGAAGVSKGGQKKPLIASGKYFAALVRGGPGSIVKVTANQVTVGVQTSAFPFAKVIRGGTGANIRLAPTLIKPKKEVAGAGESGSWVRRWAMWWYLGLTFRVWLSEAKLRAGISVPPRPHLTANPALTKKLRQIYEDYLLRGKV